MKSIYNQKTSKLRRIKLRQNSTEAEKLLWKHLRAKQIGYKFRRQYSIDKYILDFYCTEKRLAIEIDGGQHNDQQSKIYDKKGQTI